MTPKPTSQRSFMLRNQIHNAVCFYLANKDTLELDLIRDTLRGDDKTNEIVNRVLHALENTVETLKMRDLRKGEKIEEEEESSVKSESKELTPEPKKKSQVKKSPTKEDKTE